MNILYVKPAEGRRPKDPRTGALVSERGQNVPKTGYWLRRIADGDVVLAEREVKTKKRAKKQEPVYDSSKESQVKGMEAEL